MTDPRRRVVIGQVSPRVDNGRFPAKRVVGEPVHVRARVFPDGHDLIRVVVRHRAGGAGPWVEVEATDVGQDWWEATFVPTTQGSHEFTVKAWMDRFGTWRRALARKADAGVDVPIQLETGALFVEQVAKAALGDDAATLQGFAALLADPGTDVDRRVAAGLSDDLLGLMRTYDDRRHATVLDPPLTLVVDNARARFSAWYELFPRSASPDPDRHGTFADVEARLPYVAEMGFDTLYLPPIHPIGKVHRKGRNNAREAQEGDLGSPWAIGSDEGGHKAIHPALGTPEDFRRLVRIAREEHGVEVALDIALQCAPDHPYVRDHPEWFHIRPDGTIQYAENPPKKYEDIVNFDFECDDHEALWEELKSIFEHWIGQGVRTFRVDNPHTKPFRFWEWCFEQLREDHDDLVFLSEAFTRPVVMDELAKRGFTQSYTYFPWKQAKWELEEYIRHFSDPDRLDVLRANAWPNTPDILTEQLQYGGPTVFAQRLIIAATLAASYGVYGPTFELRQHVAREHGSEEYLDSEKYQRRVWDLDDPGSLRDLIARINAVRRDHPALQSDRGLTLHGVDNDLLLSWSKRDEATGDTVLVVVNLDTTWQQSGWVHVDAGALGIDPERPWVVHDLLADRQFVWHGTANFVEIDPNVLPAHVFRVAQEDASARYGDYH